jgi:pilus assembly protein Flp/PilA
MPLFEQSHDTWSPPLSEPTTRVLASSLRRFASDEGGVTAIEYGLIAGLITVLLLAAISTTGLTLRDLWVRIGRCLATPTPAGCI